MHNKIGAIILFTCVNVKHELDEFLRFPRCSVLCLKDKLSFLHQCIEEFLSFLHLILASEENSSSHRYDVKNCKISSARF